MASSSSSVQPLVPLRKRLIRLSWILGFSVLALAHVLILVRLWSQSAEDSSTSSSEQEYQTVPPPNLKKASFTRFSVDLTKAQLEKAKAKTKSKLSVSLPKVQQQSKGEGDPNANTKNNNNTTLGSFLAKLPRYNMTMEEQQQSKKNLTTPSSISPDQNISLLKLREQGIEVPPEEWDEIPSWSDIQQSFGEEPVILGLETCETYRNTVPKLNRSVAPAGNFNTGTNLFSVFWGRNCQGLADKPLLQVPWGKHNMGIARVNNYQINKTRYTELKNEHILPVVLVRHPVSWMFSTCAHSYAAHWNHTRENCPHLVHDHVPDTLKHYSIKSMMAVHVAYGYKRNNKRYYRHHSLIHFWKEWIESFLSKEKFPFPRIIVRLEDIVYRPLKVLTKLCQCVGGHQRPGGRVSMPEESVKVHRDRLRNKTGLPGSLVRGNASDTAGLLKAWKNHATNAQQWKQMSIKDKAVVKQVLMMHTKSHQHHNDQSHHQEEKQEEGLLELLHYKIEEY